MREKCKKIRRNERWRGNRSKKSKIKAKRGSKRKTGCVRSKFWRIAGRGKYIIFKGDTGFEPPKFSVVEPELQGAETFGESWSWVFQLRVELNHYINHNSEKITGSRKGLKWVFFPKNHENSTFSIKSCINRCLQAVVRAETLNNFRYTTLPNFFSVCSLQSLPCLF
jgi:hypothetical protein